MVNGKIAKKIGKKRIIYLSLLIKTIIISKETVIILDAQFQMIAIRPRMPTVYQLIISKNRAITPISICIKHSCLQFLNENTEVDF